MSLLSILLAVVVATALGMLWFSPLMFGPAWMALAGIKPDPSKKMKGMCKSLIGNILLNFVTAIMVYTILAAGFHMTDLFAIWSAFALPIFANDVFWGGAPLKLFLINAGFSIVSLAFMAQVILWVA
jgi:tetrahydromethanopterin S-methyltransferase subunit E